MPRLLDLFCGAGGAGIGYYRAGFDVVGVDINPQPHYPFEFIQGDALEYLAAHGSEYDAIHASPPCQAYTGMRAITIARYGSAPYHPDLILPVRKLLIETGKPYIIENVKNSPLRTQFILCASAMGLKNLARHRHFESNILFMNVPKCNHQKQDFIKGVYGKRPDGRRLTPLNKKLCRAVSSIDEASDLMGIDWMTWNEIKESIPPAYTEWIGKQLIERM